MNITIFTSIPSMIEQFCSHSILGRALAEGAWSLKVVNIKDYGRGLYKRIDDYSYGGGGMLMRPDVLGNCLEDNLDTSTLNKPETAFIYTSPRGKIFNQATAEEMATKISNLYILCGRFEGIDQRIIDHYGLQEVSLGNFVLLGGEVASLAILESVVRLLPNVINKSTLEEESFSAQLDGMLEYDQFTKPKVWNGISVPEVLLSGNHEQINQWRLASAKARTNDRLVESKEKRPNHRGGPKQRP